MKPAQHVAAFVQRFGVDKLRRLGTILEAVAAHGSLNKASQALRISYRQAWGLVQEAEAQLGSPLLDSRVGGSAGGGATLTGTGDDLVKRVRALDREVTQILTPATVDRGALDRPVLIASTIGPVEVGLLDALETAFHQETGIWVRHIAAGTGQALDIARSGRVDLVLTHARDEEARFIAEGWGLERIPFMANDFVICGPASDPAQVRSAPSAAAAMARIAASGSPFLSRGDRSGTHQKEAELWQLAKRAPGPPWYCVFVRGALGSGPTLREAAQRQAYTLVDRATVGLVAPGLLPTLFEGDDLLHNEFSLIRLAPERFAAVNHEGAARFCAWIRSEQGRSVIADYPFYLPIE